MLALKMLSMATSCFQQKEPVQMMCVRTIPGAYPILISFLQRNENSGTVSSKTQTNTDTLKRPCHSSKLMYLHRWTENKGGSWLTSLFTYSCVCVLWYAWVDEQTHHVSCMYDQAPVCFSHVWYVYTHTHKYTGLHWQYELASRVVQPVWMHASRLCVCVCVHARRCPGGSFQSDIWKNSHRSWTGSLSSLY